MHERGIAVVFKMEITKNNDGCKKSNSHIVSGEKLQPDSVIAKSETTAAVVFSKMEITT